MLHNDPSGAEKLFQKTLRFWGRGPARHGMSLSMIGLSRVEISRGDMKKAASQLSSVSQVLDQISVQLELGDRVDYEIALDRLKKGIGYDPSFFEETDPLTFIEIPTISASKGLPKGTALTNKETIILRLATHGLTDKQIASQLVISPHTVNAHLKSIYRKLSVNNRTAAVAVARSRQLF
jgi:DNA-binding NarL/FixJ family response regulator